jgi:beta-glucosidase
VDVKNTGKYSGDEVVQLYVKHLNSKVSRPNIELKGFNRVSIEKGQTKRVDIVLKAADLAYWDENAYAFVVEKDEVSIQIGASSKDIRLQKIIKIAE